MAQRLYFFWDYDITEDDLRAILRGDDEVEKAWAITRLLEAAKWEDIWKYLRLRDVRQWFSKLHLRPQTREVWAYALRIWDQMDAAR
jgi:hypothetical protein